MFMEMRLERRMELFEVEERRLATRGAVAVLATIALVSTGAVASATVIRAEASVALQALATAPLPLSVVVAAWAYLLRRRLREIRDRTAETGSAIAARVDEHPLAEPDATANVSPADLIAIERVLRTFYEAPSGRPAEKQWSRFRALFAPGALVESGRGGSSDSGLSIDRYVALARVEARDVWLHESERTLHVLGDVAVALSAFVAHDPDSLDPTRGMNVIRLRKARGAWQVEGVTSRPVGNAVTLRRTLAPSSGLRSRAETRRDETP